MHVRPLRPGPLAIIGDVHGEREALESLLRHLDDRHRVYLGDLIDRGPDSPGVVRLVSEEVQSGRSTVILGNHELNLLRELPKPDNGWFRGEVQYFGDEPMPQAFATEAEQISILDFIATMPLALERQDLRVVHASWGPVDEVRDTTAGVREAFTQFERSIMDGLKRDGLWDTVFRKRWRVLKDPRAKPVLDRAMQEHEYRIQNGNPVKWLTSGPEGKRDDLEWINGRWRQLERLAWWRAYREDIAVVVGHYWRLLPKGSSLKIVDSGKFGGAPPHGALGPMRNVYCIDYSVGRRFLDRLRGRPYTGRLAALLWPERDLVFDDGEVIPSA